MESINRRRFLRGVSGLAALGLETRWPRAAFADPLGLPIGLELYTVRQDAARDFDGTLRQVAAIGYKAVEMAAPANQTASSVRDSLKAAGLACPAAHFALPQFQSSLDQSIGLAQGLGVTYMVCSFLPPNERKSLDDYRRIADFFNKVGEQVQKAGLEFAYHNHNFEFTTFGGVMGYDELLRHTDPKRVKLEMDCYWVSRAGQDPVAYFQKYPGRFPLLHIKDMKPGHAPTTDNRQGGDAFAEVGRGIIDWKRIFRAAPQGGLKHYFVEQDICDGVPMECARVSYEYLKSLS